MAASQADLAAVVKQLQLEMKSGVVASTSGVDPLAELGITLEENQYASRLLALTDPGKYAADRATAFTEMKNVVKSSYDTAFMEFHKAGYPTDQAKGSALAAAEQTRRVQRLIIEQQFPSAANAIGDARTVQNAAALTGTVGMAPRAAPRRSAPRKTTTRSAADRAESARKGAATRRKNAKAKAKKK
jgi:hypothetical protein